MLWRKVICGVRKNLYAAISQLDNYTVVVGLQDYAEKGQPGSHS